MICPFCRHNPHLPSCIDYVPVREPAPPAPPAPRDTRAAAFASADTEPVRQKVFALVSSRGREGITCDEAEHEMSGLHQSISPAFHALARKRLIKDSGRRRPTRTGRAAIVWVLAGGV